MLPPQNYRCSHRLISISFTNQPLVEQRFRRCQWEPWADESQQTWRDTMIAKGSRPLRKYHGISGCRKDNLKATRAASSEWHELNTFGRILTCCEREASILERNRKRGFAGPKNIQRPHIHVPVGAWNKSHQHYLASPGLPTGVRNMAKEMAAKEELKDEGEFF